MSIPIGKPQSPRWMSLVTLSPMKVKRRCNESPIILDRRWPTCIAFATFGPPKSMTIFRGDVTRGQPSLGSSNKRSMKEAMKLSDTLTLMNPGGATETAAKISV